MNTIISLCKQAIFTSFIICSSVNADVLIDDFEAVNDWANIDLNVTTFHNGNAAGQWANHTIKKYIKKTFTTPIDASNTSFVRFWAYSGIANGTQITIKFASNNPSGTGGDYFRYPITVDWSGWKYFQIPLGDFIKARTPVGWGKIDNIELHASGWGNVPQADTLLILDEMAFGSGAIASLKKASYFVAADYIYDFDINIENYQSDTQNFSISVEADLNFSYPYTFTNPSFTLAPGETQIASIRVSIPGSMITADQMFNQQAASFIINANGNVIDKSSFKVTIPPQHRDHPRTLLEQDDFIRINQWANTYPWAKTVRDEILNSANNWETTFVNNYFGLSQWALPPEGGQWTLWYVCPVHNVDLTYDKNTGRHIDDVYGHDVADVVPDYNGWPYDQVVYSWMHRDLAEHIIDLGLSYQLTGNVQHAQSAADILLAYANKYNSYAYHDLNGNEGTAAPRGGGRVYSQFLDEDVWLTRIAWGYDLIAGSAVLTDQQRSHIKDNLLMAALDTVAPMNPLPYRVANQQSWNNAASAMVGVALEEPNLIADAILGPKGFEYQMQNNVKNDGFWEERTWGYHFYALKALEYVAETSTRAGYDLLSNPQYKSMFSIPMFYMLPDYSLPPINSGGRVDLVKKSDNDYEAAFNRYQSENCPNPYLPNASCKDLLSIPLSQGTRDRGALFWGVPNINFPAEPIDQKIASIHAPESGYAVLRAGENINKNYLIFGYGAQGYGRAGDYDGLSFHSYAAGGVMGVDPGSVRYGTDTTNTWYKQTVAHNTVTIDGKSQAYASGQIHKYNALPGISMISADAGAAYSDTALLRTLVVTEDYTLDRFHVSSMNVHTIDWLYHNFGSQSLGISSTLCADPCTDMPTGNGYQHITDISVSAPLSGSWSTTFDMTSDTVPRALNLTMLGEEGTTVLAGRGLGPHISNDILDPIKKLELERIPLVIARRTSADTVFTSLMEHKPTNGNFSTVQALQTDAIDADEVLAVAVTSTNYTDHVIASAKGTANTLKTFGNASCDGTLCLIRKNTAGLITRLAIAEGNIISDNNQLILQSMDSLVSLQVDYSPEKNTLEIQTSPAPNESIEVAFNNTMSDTTVRLNGIETGFTRALNPANIILNTAIADLNIVMQPIADSLELGNNLTYRATVTNQGPNTAFEVILTDQLSSQLALQSVTSSQGQCTGNSTVTCNLGELPAAASATVDITVTLINTGILSNTMTVDAINADDSKPVDDQATATARVFRKLRKKKGK